MRLESSYSYIWYPKKVDLVASPNIGFLLKKVLFTQFQGD